VVRDRARRGVDVARDGGVENPLMLRPDVALDIVERARIAAITFRLLVELRPDLEELR
jgi:hypothetical protein